MEPQVIADRQQAWRRTGKALQVARQSRDLAVAELAERLGLSRAYLTNVEAGRRPLTDPLATAIARVLGVPKVTLTAPGEDVAA